MKNVDVNFYLKINIKLYIIDLYKITNEGLFY